MSQAPLWTKCFHLSGGTCPQLALWGNELTGVASPRPGLTQDIYLERLGQACLECALAPGVEESS